MAMPVGTRSVPELTLKVPPSGPGGITTGPELKRNTPPVTSSVLLASMARVAPAATSAPAANCRVPASMSTVEIPDSVTDTPMVLTAKFVFFQIVPLLMMELAEPPPLKTSPLAVMLSVVPASRTRRAPLESMSSLLEALNVAEARR